MPLQIVCTGVPESPASSLSRSATLGETAVTASARRMSFARCGASSGIGTSASLPWNVSTTLYPSGRRQRRNARQPGRTKCTFTTSGRNPRRLLHSRRYIHTVSRRA